jgi:predicted TIM-barrel fold metal-dependent hydrolase
MAAEQVLEPEMPICDPHHHLYDWPSSILGLPARYLLPDFLAEIRDSGHNIRSTFFVEATAFYRNSGPELMRTLGETEFATGVAAMAESGRYGDIRVCEAIIGRVPLIHGAAAGAALDAHIAAAGGRLVGIRDAGPWDDDVSVPRGHTGPPRGLYALPEFREAFALLAPRRLAFDAWQYHPQLPEVAALADAFSDTRIVLDHVGGVLGIGPYAGQRDEVFAAWKRDLYELAKRPNVWIKLGGLCQPLCPTSFHEREEKPGSEELAAALRPYVETAIDAFGVARAMFESNFPVDGLSCSYRAIWNAFKRIASGASAAEKAALFHDNAFSCYGVNRT